MNKHLVVLSLAVISGCTQYPVYRETSELSSEDASPEQVESISKFTSDCVKNANPKSDEEPEDWLYICKNMAIEIHLRKKQAILYQRKECGGCYWKTYKKEFVND